MILIQQFFDFTDKSLCFGSIFINHLLVTIYKIIIIPTMSDFKQAAERLAIFYIYHSFGDKMQTQHCLDTSMSRGQNSMFYKQCLHRIETRIKYNLLIAAL